MKDFEEVLNRFEDLLSSSTDSDSSGTLERIIWLEKERSHAVEMFCALLDEVPLNMLKSSKSARFLKGRIQTLTSLINHETSHLNLEREGFMRPDPGEPTRIYPDV